MIKSADMRSRGFTVIELVVVMIVMAVLAVAAFVVLDPYKEIKLHAAAEKVAADILYARGLGLSTSKWYGVTFEADPVNRYRVYQIQGASRATIENPADLGKDFVVELYEYYDGVMISAVNIGGGSQVEFHPRGIPYSMVGGSPLAVTGTVSLEYGGLTRTIQITPDTGRTKIE